MAANYNSRKEVSNGSVADNEDFKSCSVEEAFDCGKMWQLLHQNILLLMHQRGLESTMQIRRYHRHVRLEKR